MEFTSRAVRFGRAAILAATLLTLARNVDAGFAGLGSLGADSASYPTAISGDGQTIVGYSTSARGDTGFVWAWGDFIMRPLSDITGQNFIPTGVSTGGSTIVGTSAGHAVAWTNGQLKSLAGFGNVPSFATGVSDNGQIVSGYLEPSPGVKRAFRWDLAQGASGDWRGAGIGHFAPGRCAGRD